MRDRILNHLMEKGSITSMQAIMDYGCTRLSHYIYLLRNDGYIIESEYKSGINRYGDRTNYCVYKLKGVEKDGGAQNVCENNNR